MADINRFLPEYARTSGLDTEYDQDVFSEMHTAGYFNTLKGEVLKDEPAVYNADKTVGRGDHKREVRKGDKVMYMKHGVNGEAGEWVQKHHVTYKWDKLSKEEFGKFKQWYLRHSKEERMLWRDTQNKTALDLWVEYKTDILKEKVEPHKHKGGKGANACHIKREVAHALREASTLLYAKCAEMEKSRKGPKPPKPPAPPHIGPGNHGKEHALPHTGPGSLYYGIKGTRDGSRHTGPGGGGISARPPMQ